VAKGALAGAGIPYTNEVGNGPAVVKIGAVTLPAPDGRGRNARDFTQDKAKFLMSLKTALAQAGYPLAADVHRIDMPRALVLLFVFVIAAAALYAPQAAALVELFPTRIRYTALSFPYHVGVGWFGGFLPVTSYAIVVATGNIYAGLWYPTIVAAMGFVISLLFLPETRKRNIEE
jgi:hypothetical protein